MLPAPIAHEGEVRAQGPEAPDPEHIQADHCRDAENNEGARERCRYATLAARSPPRGESFHVGA